MNNEFPFQLTLLKREMLTEETFVLHGIRPEGFTFTAGQYVSLEFDNTQRCYSIISGENEEVLSFLIKRIQQGRLSSVLKELPLPTKVKLGPAEGYFVDRSAHRKKVFVATGTGIAPFLAMTRSGITPFLLLQGAARQQELYFEKELTSLVDNYHRYLSKSLTQQPSESYLHAGHVTDYLRDNLIKDDYDFYLCGRWRMIRDVTHVIDDLFPEANIYSEGFD